VVGNPIIYDFQAPGVPFPHPRLPANVQFQADWHESVPHIWRGLTMGYLWMIAICREL